MIQPPPPPPRWAQRLLAWLHRLDTREEVEGDLEELYRHWHQRQGKRRADLRYLVAVLSVLPPFLKRRSHKHTSCSHPHMIRHYLTLALRNLLRQKAFSLINVLGLAIGLASATFIYLFILEEKGYDRFHPDADNLYVLGARGKLDGVSQATVMAPGAWAQALKEQFPQVKAVTQMISPGFPAAFRPVESEKILVSEQFFCVTPAFKDVLYFAMIHGNPATALQEPGSVVLTATTARRLFSRENPVGKTLEMKHVFLNPTKYIPLRVTGVIKDYPPNSHIQPDYLLSMDLFLQSLPAGQRNWTANWANGIGWFNTYVRTTGGAHIPGVVEAFASEIQTHLPTKIDRLTDPFLLPLKDLHFDEELNLGGIPRANIRYLYIFGCTAVLVLVMAAINYTNLATARAKGRAKEIGLRKILGSSRWQLMGQFLGESLLTTFVALLAGVLLVALLLPAFNALSGRHFTLLHLLQGPLVLALLGTTLLVGLLSGSYPAVYLSGLHPISALKNARFAGGRSAWFRKGLTVLQYVVTLLLIVATGVMIQQMNFIRTSALSKESDQMLSIRWSGGASLDQYRLFKQRIQEDPAMPVVTMGKHLPVQEYFGVLDHAIDFPQLGKQTYQWSALHGDFDFPKAFHLELIAGRDFLANHPADSNAYLINESALKALGLPVEKVLGLSFQIKPSWEESTPKKNGVIIGVVRDFPYQSIHHRVDPLVLSGRPDPLDQIVYVKLPAGQYPEKLARLEKIWQQIRPDDGFERWFMSEEFGRMYEAETRMANLSKTFSLLSIGIACLGLLGLSSYMASRRSKEIAVRKVVGARVPQILWLLFTPFLQLLTLTCLVAVPLAGYLMHRWLEDFSYRVDLDASTFVVGILLVVVLTFVTVSYETLRAALANPVKSLRTE